MSPEDSDRIIPLLAVFCSLFSLLIATLHDSEFYADDNHAGTYTSLCFEGGLSECHGRVISPQVSYMSSVE
jgi:hypothetical protein